MKFLADVEVEAHGGLVDVGFWRELGVEDRD